MVKNTKAAAARGPRLALATATAALTLSTVLSLSTSALAVEARLHDPYFGHAPLPAHELAELRGGFRWNNLIIDFATRILGRGFGGALIFDTTLTFPVPAGDPTAVNGVGVANAGPVSPTVTALAGGGVELKHGDPATSPQVVVQVPQFNTTIQNVQNNQALSVETKTTVNISNSSWLTSSTRRVSHGFAGSFRRSNSRW